MHNGAWSFIDSFMLLIKMDIVIVLLGTQNYLSWESGYRNNIEYFWVIAKTRLKQNFSEFLRLPVAFQKS